MAGELRVEPGTLLAAYPDMLDPNFMHSVVLICQHNEQGAYGLVTNRPTSFLLKNLLGNHPVLRTSRFPVFLGGPVDPTTLQFVHTAPEEIPGGVSLDGRLWLGGDLERMAEFVTARPRLARKKLRLFLGYAGWGEGQLEAELQGGSWLPAPPSHEALFGPAGEGTWRRVVQSVGSMGDTLKDQPPDVSWN